jgi:PAS domain S-box-containing protein
MLGYSRDEMIGRPVTDFLSEADQAIYREQVAKRMRGETESYGLSWLKKNGGTIFTRVSPKPILDERGRFRGSFAVVTDITERKQAEEALEKSEKQLRFLSSQLLTAQETERKRISRELHDELGQSLTVLKLRLNFIEKNLFKDQTDLRQECEIGVHNINRLIENIRRLSRDLSPTILDDFGLSAALRWLVNNFAQNYNIKVNLNMMDIDGLLPRVSHVAVYRTVQEALTNIGKHARAKNVSMTVNEDDNRILFSIEDDGIGFDSGITALNNPDEKGLGLATMRGRAEMVGGRLDIWTEEGTGTRIMMSFPIQRGEP